MSADEEWAVCARLERDGWDPRMFEPGPYPEADERDE